jgi:hypothetical protein
VCFGPIVPIIGHWFKRRRGFVLGVTALGSSIEGTVSNCSLATNSYNGICSASLAPVLTSIDKQLSMNNANSGLYYLLYPGYHKLALKCCLPVL